MRFDKRKVTAVAIFSLFVGALQFLLSAYIYPALSITTSQLFSISASTAINSPTLGTKLVSFLTGILHLNFDIPTVILMYLGTFVLVWLGLWGYEKIGPSKVSFASGETSKVFLTLLYGTVILYAILLALNWAQFGSMLVFPLLIALALNYAVIAIVTSVIAKYVKAARI